MHHLGVWHTVFDTSSSKPEKRQNYRAIIFNYGPETTDGEILALGTPRLSSRKAKENMCDGNKCDRQALDT